MSDIMLYGVLRMPYELAMSDEISRLQFYQRAQEAADRLEKCEITNTTPSQAASIADDDKLHSLIEKFARQSSGCSCVHCDERRMAARREIFAHIDAKLAQARQEGFLAGGQHQHEVEKERAEKAEQYAQVALGIKDSLESRLAEIQRGAEGLLQYIADHDWGGIPEPVPQIDALRALLQPQGQADTSGLPG